MNFANFEEVVHNFGKSKSDNDISEKMLIFNICRCGLMPNLIRKSWTVSSLLAKDKKIDLKHHKRHSFLLFCAKKQERKNSWKTTNIGVATIEKVSIFFYFGRKFFLTNSIQTFISKIRKNGTPIFSNFKLFLLIAVQGVSTNNKLKSGKKWSAIFLSFGYDGWYRL